MLTGPVVLGKSTVFVGFWADQKMSSHVELPLIWSKWYISLKISVNSKNGKIFFLFYTI